MGLHLYKLPLNDEKIDVFFSEIDMIDKTITFLVTDKEGKALPVPDAPDARYGKRSFTIMGDIVNVDNLFMFPLSQLQSMKTTLS
jgi:hypothetical protein